MLRTSYATVWVNGQGTELATDTYTTLAFRVSAWLPSLSHHPAIKHASCCCANTFVTGTFSATYAPIDSSITPPFELRPFTVTSRGKLPWYLPDTQIGAPMYRSGRGCG